MAGIVETWFGHYFQKLHPLIQRLHQYDHRLNGTVQIEYADGLAGKIGRSIGQTLGVPVVQGSTELRVDINHAADHFSWSRQFGKQGKPMQSKFYPVGCYPEGGWREQTSGVDLLMGVEIKNGAWHWQQKSLSIRGVPAPRAAVPKIIAYKEIIDDQYYFYADFSLLGLGRLFKYTGFLSAAQINH